MKKYLIFLFSGFLLMPWLMPELAGMTAKEGIIDLRNHDFKNDGIVKLKGEWEFYWEKFYDPDFINQNHPVPDAFIQQPISWLDLKSDSVKPTVLGFATYRLRVVLPDYIFSMDESPLLGLKVVECHSAYEIFINGKKHGGSGSISRSPEDFVPRVIPAVYAFMPESDTVEIIILAANFFDHNQGGMDDHVMLGNYSQIHAQSDSQSALFIIAFAILFFMAIYHFILYILRRKERLNLYFSLICLVMALFSVWQGNKLILLSFPGMSMELYFRIWMAAIGGVGLWYLFYAELLPKEITWKVTRIVGSFYLLHTILALVLPTSFYFKIINVIFIITLLSLIWLFIAFIRAVINKRDFAVIIFIGMLIPIAAAINDALFGLDLIVTGYYAPAGFLFFLLSQSFLISLKFSRSFHQVEVLSSELEALNISLENKVEERTAQLTKANEELQEINLTKDKFISIITHDLRNPFGIIINISELLLKREFVKSDPETEKLLNLLKDAADKSHKLLENLVEWSKIQSGKILFAPVTVDLHRLIEESIQLLKPHFFTKEIEVVNKVEPLFTLQADLNMLNLILRNLLTNAVKYSYEGGRIEIEAVKTGSKSEVSVRDFGKGISDKQMSRLFRIDLKNSEKGTKNETGTGLGLILCHEFIQMHGGEIWIESKPGEGSRVIFKI